ncbi:MAG: hypothetical protein JEZ03_00725 [Bacteroidales bacterium]|nr:hypothetical protein [Bacteroidales bacterium]
MKPYTRIILLTIICTLSLLSFSQKFTQEQLQEDVTYFFDKIEKIHVNPNFRYSKQEIDSLELEILNQVYPMDVTEFSIWLMPKVNYLFDGHTGLEGEFCRKFLGPKKDKGLVLNFGEKALNDTRDTLFLELKEQILKHHKHGKYPLFSAGNIPVYNLINYTEKSIASDFRKPHKWKVSDQLGETIALLVEYDTILPVEILVNGSVVQDTIVFANRNNETSQAKQEQTSASVEYKNEFQIWEDTNTAIFYLRTCNRNVFKEDEYLMLLDVFFDSVANSEIQHLFIDVKDNGGGDSKYALMLLDYICSEKQVIKVDESISKGSEELFRRNTNYFAKQLNLTRQSEVDSLYLLIACDTNFNKPYPYRWGIEPKDKVFEGEVYVLQSCNTFSAPISLCATAKYYNFATLVGAETGGLTQTYIDCVIQQLPNSRMMFCSSSKYSSYVGSEPFKGVVPDIQYQFDQSKKGDDVYYMTLDELKSIIEKYQKYDILN